MVCLKPGLKILAPFSLHEHSFCIILFSPFFSFIDSPLDEKQATPAAASEQEDDTDVNIEVFRGTLLLLTAEGASNSDSFGGFDFPSAFVTCLTALCGGVMLFPMNFSCQSYFVSEIVRAASGLCSSLSTSVSCHLLVLPWKDDWDEGSLSCLENLRYALRSSQSSSSSTVCLFDKSSNDILNDIWNVDTDDVQFAPLPFSPNSWRLNEVGDSTIGDLQFWMTMAKQQDSDRLNGSDAPPSTSASVSSVALLENLFTTIARLCCSRISLFLRSEQYQPGLIPSNSASSSSSSPSSSSAGAAAAAACAGSASFSSSASSNPAPPHLCCHSAPVLASTALSLLTPPLVRSMLCYAKAENGLRAIVIYRNLNGGCPSTDQVEIACFQTFSQRILSWAQHFEPASIRLKSTTDALIKVQPGASRQQVTGAFFAAFMTDLNSLCAFYREALDDALFDFDCLIAALSCESKDSFGAGLSAEHFYRCTQVTISTIVMGLYNDMLNVCFDEIEPDFQSIKAQLQALALESDSMKQRVDQYVQVLFFSSLVCS